MTAKIVASTTSGLQIKPDNSGSLELQVNNTTSAITVDTYGIVGVGTTTPSSSSNYTALVIHNSTTPRFRLTNSTTGQTATDGGELSMQGNDLYIENREAGNLITYVNGSENMRIDSSGVLYFNSGYGSSAKTYGCRAWVNFNGTGTVAIRASGNVSSITDNGTGDYTVNLTTAMPDTSYSVGLSIREDTSGTSAAGAWNQVFRSSAAISTSSVRVLFANGSTKYDVDTYCVQIFR